MRELDSDYEDSEKDEGEDEDEVQSDDEIPLPKKKTIRFSDENEKNLSDEENKGPTAVQQKLLTLSGQNIDEFMKEMENMQKKKDEERALEIKRVDPTPDVSGISEEKEKPVEPPKPETEKIKETPVIPAPPVSGIVLPPIPAPGMPLMFRPPPLRPGLPMMRMPPSGPRPNMMAPNMRMGLRMPPAPPLGIPPARNLHHSQKHHGHPSSASQGSKDPKSATITAKPQIRNLSADVTRFVPTTVRVKRDDNKKPRPPKLFQQEVQKQTQVNKGPTKDDAYQQFMNEMQGFL